MYLKINILQLKIKQILVKKILKLNKTSNILKYKMQKVT